MRPSVMCSADPSLRHLATTATRRRGKSPPAPPSLSAGMASCRTLCLGVPKPPSPPRTPARAIDDKGEPADATRMILEA